MPAPNNGWLQGEHRVTGDKYLPYEESLRVPIILRGPGRTDRYTYVVWSETGEEELYDREADPYQLENVAADPALAGIRTDLAGKLAKLEKCEGRACDVRP